MDARTRILVTILAETDAVWLPNRKSRRPRPANVYIARRDYAAAGVPWGSNEPSEAGRKAAQRELEALADAELVRVSRPKRMRALGVKLTDAGDVLARGLCGLPGVYSAWVAMQELATHSRRPPETMRDVWVPEIALAGRNMDAAELAAIENMILPALVRGRVVSAADIAGRVSYALTPAGWRFLDGAAGPRDDEGGPTEADADAVALYDEHLAAEMGRLDTADADPREIGDIPLPVAMMDLPASEPWLTWTPNWRG